MPSFIAIGDAAQEVMALLEADAVNGQWADPEGDLAAVEAEAVSTAAGGRPTRLAFGSRPQGSRMRSLSYQSLLGNSAPRLGNGHSFRRRRGLASCWTLNQAQFLVSRALLLGWRSCC
jgi:hypothetical protein